MILLTSVAPINVTNKQTLLKQNAIGTTLNAKFWPPPKTKPDGRTGNTETPFSFLDYFGLYRANFKSFLSILNMNRQVFIPTYVC